MGINVVVAKNYVPVDILGEEYRFYRTDNVIIEFEAGMIAIADRVAVLETDEFRSKSAGEQLTASKEVMIDAFDFLFPEQDSFSKIYKEVQTISVMVDIYEQVLEGLLVELKSEEQRNKKSRLDKYLKHKKK